MRLKPVDSKKKVSLRDADARPPRNAPSGDKLKTMIDEQTERIANLQRVFYGDARYAMLIVLQGRDASGKDGTIRHVFSAVNPQACEVTSFKVPTDAERHHDFLWRIHQRVPARGVIGIFNRSHYEDVLVARVHNLVPKAVWSRRYDDINAFESLLAEQGVVIVKCFLHISKEEQKERFEDRINDKDKQWKLSAADFAERKYWGAYQKAFEDALSKCSTERAPWYVIPADKKWFRNLAVCRILVETLEGLRMKFPKPSVDISKLDV